MVLHCILLRTNNMNIFFICNLQRLLSDKVYYDKHAIGTYKSNHKQKKQYNTFINHKQYNSII